MMYYCVSSINIMTIITSTGSIEIITAIHQIHFFFKPFSFFFISAAPHLQGTPFHGLKY